jgi:glycosyltransferase involved in cell wall biosynthesis
MHGGSLTLARLFFNSGFEPDLIVATDMLDLSTFLSITRRATSSLPIVLYAHENQLTYPLPKDPNQGGMRRQRGERDLHYAFINLTSMLSADRVVFNSEFHLQSVIENLPKFLGHFPEYRELQCVDSVRERSIVLPVGIDFTGLGEARVKSAPEGVPLILWNQRLEYDKNPAVFLSVLEQIAAESVEFRVALCGESFQRQAREFLPAIERLGDRVIHFGFAPLKLYRQLLWRAEITVSTAVHEFFGVSIVEATACETFPILPRRLSYPEIIPSSFHQHCLYRSREELGTLLKTAIQERARTRRLAIALSADMRRFDWKSIIQRYDSLFGELVSD